MKITLKCVTLCMVCTTSAEAVTFGTFVLWGLAQVSETCCILFEARVAAAMQHFPAHPQAWCTCKTAGVCGCLIL